MLLDGLGERALGELVAPTAFAISLGAGLYSVTGESVTFSPAIVWTLTAGFYSVAGEQTKELVARKDSFQAGFFQVTGKSLQLTQGTAITFVPPSPPKLQALESTARLFGIA